MVRTASRTPQRCQISSRTAARLHSANDKSNSSGVWRRIRSRASASCAASRNRPCPFEAMPRTGPARTALQPGRTPLSVALADVEYPGRAQADLRRDRTIGQPGLAQPDHLPPAFLRSEEHTSELQSRQYLV